MGYQFVHLESYSRKADSKGRSTDFIFAEASRKPEASVHVQNPLPPVVVYGVGVEAVQEMHDDAAAAATIKVKGGHVRKVARDKKTLHTVVASHPYTMDEICADRSKRAEADEWEKRTISWIRSLYGDDLKSVIRHEDESHFHIHAYIVPTDDPEMKAIKFHPGTMAKRAITGAGPAADEDAKTLGKRADAAYKQAMREWQDSYHEAVAAPCGLTRLGPARRRLSREEWHHEKSQAQALQKTVARAKAVKANGNKFVDRTKVNAAEIMAKASSIQAEAEKKLTEARQATAAALAAQDRALKQQQQAQEAMLDARRYAGWAGRFRALWDGLRKSSIVEKIRAEIAPEIERYANRARDLQKKIDTEREKRREAEEAARTARQAAAQAALERDRVRSLLKFQGDQAPAMGPVLTLKPGKEKPPTKRST